MLEKYTAKIHQFMHRSWYPLLTGALAFLDLFVGVIPTDGLVVTAAMAHPKRWLYIGIVVTIGSSLGALIISGVVVYDVELIHQWFPQIFFSETWKSVEHWVNQFGLWAIFFCPWLFLPIQLFLIIAGLAKLGLSKIMLAYVAGRFVKTTLIAFLAGKFPHVLDRIAPEWIKEEIEVAKKDY
jgi:membrane protein YqaA with SNARE-associated domain